MTISHHEMPSANDELPLADSRDGARLSLIALAVAVLLAFALLGMLFVQRFIARIPELTPEELTAAEQLWDEQGPPSYDLDLVIEGAQPGVVHVEVRNGVATAMQRDGITPKQQRVWDVWSVPGMFDTIEIELQNAEDPQHGMGLGANTSVQLRAEFDISFGYPARFHRIVFGGGPEVYWRVTNFQPQ